MNLKRSVLLGFLLLLGTFGSQAFEREFTFGANSGIISSLISFEPSIDNGHQLGFTGGVTARFVSEKNCGLQAELNYSQRGWKERYDGIPTYSRTLGYVELPLLTHIYFGRKLRFFVNLGPKISYLMFDNIKNQSETPRAQDKEVTNKFDYGLCAGGGFDYSYNSRIHYLAEFRYYYGLGDLYSNGRSDDFQRSAYRDICLNLVILYRL